MSVFCNSVSGQVKCPHCGMERRTMPFPGQPTSLVFQTCEQEDGGCGTLFAFRAMISVATTVYLLKEIVQS